MGDSMLPSHDTGAFLDNVLGFRDFGSPTQAREHGGIPYFENEFWTSAQRKAHPLHEVSYRGCFKGQLPGFFIDRLSFPGETVLDPFMGRGTTLLQAALTGRHPVGNDINPLSAMLVEPRLNPPTVAQVAKRLAEVPWSKGCIGRKDLLAFYHPNTLVAICALKEWLNVRTASGMFDHIDGWIRMVTLNRLSGHSVGFLSGRTLPPNQAVSVTSQLRINERLQLSPPERDVPSLLLTKTRFLLKSGPPPPHPASSTFTGHADHLHGVRDSSVTLVVTSPPFLDVIDYAKDNWLRCWFADIDVSVVPVSVHRSEAAWRGMVRESLTELARVTKPGGHIAFEVGEVRGGRILLEQIVWDAAHGLPLDRVAVLVNQQKFSKTANLWGISNGSKGTNTNRVVIFRRA